MIRPDREALMSFGVLGALLIVCAVAVAFSCQAWSDATNELDRQKALLSQLEARAAVRKNARLKSGTVAPAAAFLAAPTQGLAGAQLQAHIQRVADAHHAVLISSGIEQSRHEDRADSIRLQATLDANVQSLQALLYQLESGTPYVFVESLDVKLPGMNAQRAVEDPLLRITLELRATWRRETV
jgi:general secretion pathway protein M